MHPLAVRILVSGLVTLGGWANLCGEIHRVESVAALAHRLATARPGDVLVVAAGIHRADAPIRIAVAGTEGRPITVRAERVGAVEIAGTHGLEVLRGAAYIVIEGFRFTHASGQTRVRPPGARQSGGRRRRTTVSIRRSRSRRAAPQRPARPGRG